jgi:hypothetical protein
MSSLTRTATAIGVALLAAALPAAAGAAQAPFVHTPVPAGQLQHTVTDVSYPAATNSQVPHVARADGTFPGDTLRTESWIGATAGRKLTTDLMTGKIVSDCAFTTIDGHCFSAGNSDKDGHNIAPNGVVWVFAGDASVLQSWTDFGNGIKDLIGDPRGYTQTGTTTYLGRPAIVLHQATAPAPGGVGTESETVIAEADNGYPLYRDTVSDNPNVGLTQHFDQVTETRVLETIAPGVKLTIGYYPGAEVRDLRPTAATTASKKASSHKKATHKKKKVVHKHKGYGTKKPSPKHKTYAKKAA